MEKLFGLKVIDSRRRGSSWPVVVATDYGPFLVKLTGAGNGPLALVAEWLVAALAETIGLYVPFRQIVCLDDWLGCQDRDPELLELLTASRGPNLGFQWLEGTRELTASEIDRVSPAEAAAIFWLDWLVMNPDRTARNPNLLWHLGNCWLIDHGSALTFHHDWASVTEDQPARNPSWLCNHLFEGRLRDLWEWDATLTHTLGRDKLRAAVASIPAELIGQTVPGRPSEVTMARRREAYVAFLWKRLKSERPRHWDASRNKAS